MLGAINYTPHPRVAATLSMRYYFRGPQTLSVFSHFSLSSFPDLPASAEIWDEIQPCVTGTFQCPSPRNRKIGTHEGSLPISKSGDRRPSAADDVRAEKIPTVNRTTILFIPKDSMSLVISQKAAKTSNPSPGPQKVLRGRLISPSRRVHQQPPGCHTRRRSKSQPAKVRCVLVIPLQSCF